jgi:hypothetical protein
VTINTSAVPGADELDEQIEIQVGRRAPFTQVGDWVLLSGISDRAVALYSRLSMHINVQRGDTEAWPAQEVLAEWADFSKASSITPYADELVVIGAITIEQTRFANGLRARNRYVVHQMPPSGYVGPVSAAQYYELRRTKPEELTSWRTERRAWIGEQVKLLEAGRRSAKQNRKSDNSDIPVLRSGGVRTPLRRSTERPAETPDGGSIPVLRSSGVRSPLQRTPVVRPSGVELDEVQEDEASLSSDAPDGNAPDRGTAPVAERETIAKAINDDCAKVVDAWLAARGGRRNGRDETRVRKSAASLLAVGRSLADVVSIAKDMAVKYPTGTDLTIHDGHWSAAKERAVPVLAKWCGCGGNPNAEFNGRFRTHDGTASGQPCFICHPDAMEASA